MLRYLLVELVKEREEAAGKEAITRADLAGLHGKGNVHVHGMLSDWL